MTESINTYLSKIPAGYSEVCFMDEKYGVRRTDFNDGRSSKIVADELGGGDVISFNVYRTAKGNLLKPCEMPEQKVIRFLTGMEINLT